MAELDKRDGEMDGKGFEKLKTGSRKPKD